MTAEQQRKIEEWREWEKQGGGAAAALRRLAGQANYISNEVSLSSIAMHQEERENLAMALVSIAGALLVPEAMGDIPWWTRGAIRATLVQWGGCEPEDGFPDIRMLIRKAVEEELSRPPVAL